MAKSFLNQPGLPRGLRNNNPGNLRPGIQWEGAIGNDGSFLIFKSIAYGLRAMALDLGNDIRLKGKNTLRQLITEYAPPSENNTEAYIATVSSYTGWASSQAIPLTEAALLKLIRGMLNVELGVQYSSMITDQDISEAFTLLPLAVRDYFGIAGSGISFQPNWLVIGVVAAFVGWPWIKKKFFQ